MTQSAENLIWIDLEMTGLDTVNDVIIEIATVITDSQLNVLEEGPMLAIHQTDATLDAMDDWNQKQHGGSGLIQRIKDSQIDAAEAERQTIAFIGKYVAAGVSPMCGNSICQDRRFMARLMPGLEEYFHYRNLDVSTIKELASRWAPDMSKGFEKKGSHLAMDDIHDSIRELAHYREHFFNVPQA